MSVFSVYNYDRREYDYYTAPGPGGAHAGAPPRPAFQHELGATPEGGTWKLPLSARKVGSGALPRGRIAASAMSLGAFGLGDLTDDMPRYGVLAGIAYLAWRFLR